MTNAYVRRLMEMEGPTDKDLKDIEKEKPTSRIPKKRYFGGKTDPKKVDTAAAIATHKAGIRAAGEATKKPEELPEATGGPNTRKMTDAETQAMKNLASAGRGGEHDRTSPPPRPGAEPERSPSGSKRSKKTKEADEKAGVVVSHTEYHRIGRIFIEAIGKQPERNKETGSGSNFEPGEGPKDPKEMTPAEKKAADTKTAKEMAKRAASNK